jgi:hypothetical protein
MVTVDREEIVKTFTDSGVSIIPNSLDYAVLTWTSRNIKFNSFDAAMRSAEFTERVKKSFNNMIGLNEKVGSDKDEIKNIILNYPKIIIEPFASKVVDPAGDSVQLMLDDFVNIGEIKLPFPAMTMVEAVGSSEHTINGFTHSFLKQIDGGVEVLVFIGLSADPFGGDHERAFADMLPFRMILGVAGNQIRFLVKAVGYKNQKNEKEVCVPNELLLTHTVLSALKCIHKTTINDGGEGCYISKPTPREIQVNRKKLTKKRVPLVEFRLVKIEPRKIQLPSMPHGTHASPRQHWRRGHWRTYASGKKVFVNPMLVGDEKNGKIIKDYVVGGSVSAH